ncbi:hypothetical protein [Ulvibacter litoralis]|uniref:hypothetical protein n=1 Tax=Ulvibacter litoralis TaxID=227084 RepID=UPI0011130B11|nr:hypothetical protein [Ulvibacter litoralis]
MNKKQNPNYSILTFPKPKCLFLWFVSFGQAKEMNRTPLKPNEHHHFIITNHQSQVTQKTTLKTRYQSVP